MILFVCGDKIEGKCGINAATKKNNDRKTRR
jgi:hypothetical protein